MHTGWRVPIVLTFGLTAAGAHSQSPPHFQEPPAQQIAKDLTPEARGDQLLSEGEYSLAIKAYNRALEGAGQPATIWGKIGDAHNAATYEHGPEAWQHAREAWERAVELDHQNLAAWERLLDFWCHAKKQGREAVDFDCHRRIAEIASAILEIEPQHQQALHVIHSTEIFRWLEDTTGDFSLIDAALDQLAVLAERHPAKVEILEDMSFAYAQRGLMLGRNGDAEGGKTQIDKAYALIDEAMKRQPFQSGPYYTKFYIFTVVGSARVAKLPPNEQTEARKKLDAEVNSLIYSAAANMSPGDRFQVPIMNTVAGLALDGQDRELVDAILRALWLADPDHPQIRATVALWIYKHDAKFDEAIDLLDHPRNRRPLHGEPGVHERFSEYSALHAGCYIRLSRYEANGNNNPSANELLMARVRQDMAKLAEVEADRPRFLAIKGKKELLLRDYAAAIATLQHGLEENEKYGWDRVKNDLLWGLARAYARSDQPTQAEPLLHRLISDAHFNWARIELARIQLARGDIRDASESVDLVRREFPNATEVRELTEAIAQRRK